VAASAIEERLAVTVVFAAALSSMHVLYRHGLLRTCDRDPKLQACDKQYKSIVEIEEHLSSYDHHHKKRLKELKQMELARTRDQRARHEAKREAKAQERLNRQCVPFPGSCTAGSVGHTGVRLAGAEALFRTLRWIAQLQVQLSTPPPRALFS
jgi:hypothetical protein